MKSLRVTVVLASLLTLSASPLSAQASKVSCKDGSKPKVGHFSCWGHGGLVTGAVKPAAKPDAKTATKPEAKPASKAVKKDHAPSKVKTTTRKKSHAAAAKADKKKTHAKKSSKHGKKKQHHTARQTA